MKFPSMPVLSNAGATLNFDKLQKRLTEFDESIAILYRSTAQTLPEGTVGVVKVNTVLQDPGKHLSPEVGYKVPVTGYYQVNGSVSVLAQSGVYIITEIRVNGFVRILGGQYGDFVGSESSNATTVSGVIVCQAGDLVELWAGNNAGKTTLNIAPYTNVLSVVRVA
jgi:hypothetical protein